jgi:hypothetical protein
MQPVRLKGGHTRRPPAARALQFQQSRPLFLAAIRIDFRVGIRAQNLRDVAQFIGQPRTGSGRGQRTDEVDATGDPCELATMTALDTRPDMRQFVRENGEDIQRTVEDGVDEHLEGAISRDGRVECLTQCHLA